MNPTQAYWNAIARGADVAELDMLNDTRIAFERPMSVTQINAVYSAMGVNVDHSETQRTIDAEVASVVV